MRLRRVGAIAIALAFLVARPGVVGAGPSSSAGAGGRAVPAAPAAQPAPSTVNIYGKAGTFGAFQSQPRMPSGQTLMVNAVPGWQFAPGRQFAYSALGSDGTVFTAGLDQSFNQTFQTSPQAVIGAFNPASPSLTNIALETTTGKTTVTIPPGPDNREGRGGATVSDVEAIDGGNAIAFTTWLTHYGQDVATEGVWPAFGVLTKVGGQWQVASGSGWTNQWSGKELRAKGRTPAVGASACPDDVVLAPSESHCKGMSEIDSLPVSHDIIATQYAGMPDDTGSGGLVALRLTGPDANGQYDVEVRGHYPFPVLQDPAHADNQIRVSGLSVQADPSSTSATDERFSVAFDLWNTNTAAYGFGYQGAWPIMEFSYDSTTGQITPASAPFVSNEPAGSSGGSFKHTVYDSSGNLYAPRYPTDGTLTPRGGRLAVFAKVDGQRRTATSQCGFDPAHPNAPLDSYTRVVDGTTVWGVACQANYDIIQPKDLFWSSEQLVEDPVTHDILTLTWRGELVAIRPSGSGEDMTFQIGNVVDIGKFVVDGAGAPWSALGPIDPTTHRAWMVVGRANPAGQTEAVVAPYWTPPRTFQMVVDGQPSENWLYSVDVDDLFAPPALSLPSSIDQAVAVHAEQTATNTTTKRTSTRISADWEFDAHAHVLPCNGACTADLVPGDGFTLDEEVGFGFNGTVTYNVNVPTAGWYRPGYITATWGSQTGATITAQVDSLTPTVTTSVYSSSGDFPLWAFIQSQGEAGKLFFPAGNHTLKLIFTQKAYLNWFNLTRVTPPP